MNSDDWIQKKIRVGTSGWSYPSGKGRWTEIFYPVNLRDELHYYSSIFNTVEVNSTFYRPVSPHVARSWIRRVPSDFEFTIKLWNRFTHPMMREDNAQISDKDYDLFRKGIDPIVESGKFGCLLLQFPPSFAFTTQSIEKLCTILDKFRTYRKVIELRNRTWSDNMQQTLNILKENYTSLVYIDEPKFKSSIEQELNPSGEILYIRLHGRNRQKWWKHEDAEERYDYLYSVEELKPIAEKIKIIGKSPSVKTVYVFFNNHPRGQAPANALMMKNLLGFQLPTSLHDSFLNSYPMLRDMLSN